MDELPATTLIYVPADPTIGKFPIGSTNHTTPIADAIATQPVRTADHGISIPYTNTTSIAGIKQNNTQI